MMVPAAATRFFFISVSSFFLGGCGRYADFTLPLLPQAEPAHPTFKMERQPVLSHAAVPGAWDSVDALNPSVVMRSGVYYNLYSGFDGTAWHTGLAMSSDGEHWTKKGRVISPTSGTWEGSYIAANGSALYEGGEFLYWYQAGEKETPRIAFARSADGITWSKEPKPVLDFGPSGSWDELGLGDPYVLKLADWFYLYYVGLNRARQQHIGLARSRDGVRWEKLRGSPVVELPVPGSGAMDENGDGEPAVWKASGSYWMLFTGRDTNEHRSLALAWSRDGVVWRRLDTYRGAAPWNAAVLCDPTVLQVNGLTRVWFGGGDAASPDENLHGQIGMGTLQ